MADAVTGRVESGKKTKMLPTILRNTAENRDISHHKDLIHQLKKPLHK